MTSPGSPHRTALTKIVIPAPTGFGLLGGNHIVGVGASTEATSRELIRQASKPIHSSFCHVCTHGIFQRLGQFIQRQKVTEILIYAVAQHWSAAVIPEDQAVGICREEIKTVI